MEEMKLEGFEPVYRDGGLEVGKLVQSLLEIIPIEGFTPMANQTSDVLNRGASLSSASVNLICESYVSQLSIKSLDIGTWDGDLVRRNVGCHDVCGETVGIKSCQGK